MSWTAKQAAEEYFLQGLSSARGGLAAETCPYDYVTDNASASIVEICAPVNWREGWQFGKFVAIQRLRREKIHEVRSAVRELFLHEPAYSEMCRTVNQGLLKAGLKYFSAQRSSDQLARKIRQSKKFRLLHDLYIELYLPWRPDEHPYSFNLFDRLLNVFGNNTDSERTLRGLVERYGDRHGVRAAWHEYVYAEPMEKMIPVSSQGNRTRD